MFSGMKGANDDRDGAVLERSSRVISGEIPNIRDHLAIELRVDYLG